MDYQVVDIDKDLRLVQLTTEQADGLFELIDNDREYLSQWLPWPEHTKTVGDSRAFIESTIKKREVGEEYGYGIEYLQRIIGHASLMHLSGGNRPEIGYWIASDFSGRGITTRVALALAKLGRDSLGLNEIIIRAEPENVGSNKVAESTGFELIGQEENDGKIMNVWRGVFEKI